MLPVPILSARDAAGLVKSGDVLLVGGFGMTGNPVQLLHALADRSDVDSLTYVGNNVGEPGLGGGRLLRNGQISNAIGSFFTSNPEAVAAAQSGAMSTELLPQGTLAEALRAGGAGIGGFYTKTGVGTDIARGRDTRVIDGDEYVFQPGIRGNVAFIRAWAADSAGNLQYRQTEQNFNTAMATAADIVVAEVEHIVDVGKLDANAIHTPGCYVDYLVQAPLTVEALGSSADITASRLGASEQRLAIARMALRELKRGEIVNLGIGIPTLVADLLQPTDGITLHTENGMLGVGPAPISGGALDYPVNAGKVPVTELPDTSYFDSSASFAMIRGGHVDVAVMGALQVDQSASIANWAVPGRPLLGVGGAMDLANGARRLIVTMTHVNRDGSAKLVRECTLPRTAGGVVDTVITDLGVFRFVDGALYLTALAPEVSVDDVRNRTEAEFAVRIE
ncbi:MAG: 3-oxoacid CoA-transferase [Pseudomonadota bacterium]